MSKKSKKSTKRKKANRLNAQKSTGPVTEAGKAVSSQNAAKHHLFSQKILLPHESEERYQAFYAETMAYLAPVGEHERYFAERYVNDLWRAQRVYEYEVRIYQEFDGKPELAAKLELLSRAQARLDNRIFRARKELWALQAERRRRELKRVDIRISPADWQAEHALDEPEKAIPEPVLAEPETDLGSFCNPLPPPVRKPRNLKERLAMECMSKHLAIS